MSRTVPRYATTRSYGQCVGPLGFPMLEEQARALEDHMKNLSDELKEVKCEIGGQLVEGYGRRTVISSEIDLPKGERSDVSLITSAALDRDREVMLPEGADWKSFKQNPVVGFGHNFQIPPIGRATWIKRRRDDDPNKNGFLAKTLYAKKPASWTGDWFPDAVWAMVQDGFLRGKSIGFIPLEVRSPSPDDVKKRPELADARAIISKYSVIEYSVVGVQSNPLALVEQVAKSVRAGHKIPESVLDALEIGIPDEQTTLSEMMEIEDDEPQLPSIRGCRVAPARGSKVVRALRMFERGGTDEMVKEIMSSIRGDA